MLTFFSRTYASEGVWIGGVGTDVSCVALALCRDEGWRTVMGWEMEDCDGMGGGEHRGTKR
jgi:hypothetical protein